jgi:hypothetical protein
MLKLSAILSLFLALPTFAAFDGVSTGGGADSCAYPFKPYVYRCQVYGQTKQGHWYETMDFTNQHAKDNEHIKGTGMGEGFSLMLCPDQKGTSPLKMVAWGSYVHPGKAYVSTEGSTEAKWGKEFNFQFGLNTSDENIFFKVECKKIK